MKKAVLWESVPPIPVAVRIGAACRRGNVEFFPLPGQRDVAERAKATCSTCPVLAECRAYALAAPALLEGVWGGTSATERARLRAAAVKETR